MKTYQLPASTALPIELLVPGAAPALAIINIKVFTEIEPSVSRSLGVSSHLRDISRSSTSR